MSKIANVLLGIADSEDRFTIKYGILRFKLKIKPITARQLIAISAEISQIKPISEDYQEMFTALMANSSDLVHIANVIAIATGTRWKKIVARAVMRLDLKDINTLFKIVYKQSDPSPFFLTYLQIGKINILKKKEE